MTATTAQALASIDAALAGYVSGDLDVSEDAMRCAPQEPVIPDGYRECDSATLLAQIGTMNVMAISGLRVIRRPTGVTLPVGRSYSVTVDLAANDTYTVRRVFTRSGVAKIMGEVDGVYCEDVGETAYRASCFVNVKFPA